MTGFSQIRLYQNTTSSIPVGVYTDITSEIIANAATSSVVEGVSYDYDNCLKTVSGLSPATQYWFWIEAIDEAGNTSGIRPLGSITTAPPGQIVPQNFTGYTNGGYTVDRSSIISSDFEAWGVFDGKWGWQNSTWKAASGFNEWISIELPEPKIVTSIAWHYNSFHAPLRRPFDVRFEGWNGVEWDVLYTNNAVQYPDTTTKPNFPGTGQLDVDVVDTTYTLFRFFIVRSEDGFYTHLDRFFVYGY